MATLCDCYKKILSPAISLFNMSDDFPLIPLGHLTKPIKVFIEKTSKAIGVLYKPVDIVRIAKAKAAAAIIDASAEIEIGDLRHRAELRAINQQSNIESVLIKAISLLNEDARPEAVPDDFFAEFFEYARRISSDDLQNLWAKLLAGAANTPGAFSKRTMNIIANIDQADAVIFRNLCGFMWNIEVEAPLILDFESEIYKREHINFDSLYDLVSLDLIQFRETLI